MTLLALVEVRNLLTGAAQLYLRFQKGDGSTLDLSVTVEQAHEVLAQMDAPGTSETGSFSMASEQTQQVRVERAAPPDPLLSGDWRAGEGEPLRLPPFRPPRDLDDGERL